MRRTMLFLTLAAAMLLACTGVVLAQSTTPDQGQRSKTPPNDEVRQGPPEEKPVPNQYIVELKEDAQGRPGDVGRRIAREHGGEVLAVYQAALKGFAIRLPDARAKALEEEPEVDSVVQDHEVQAFGVGTAELPTGINRVDGEKNGLLSGDPATSDLASPAVAIIDSGIYAHPDLNRKGGKNCAWWSGTSYNDGSGHGTHVAGTVGARYNGTGVAGVAPGAPLYAVRVLDNSGGGTDSSVICGIDWVTQYGPSYGIKAANMSLGRSNTTTEGSCADANKDGKPDTNDDKVHTAICNSVNKANVTYVVAAGNSTKDLKDYGPAKYDAVLTVTAVADSDGQPGGTTWATNPDCKKSDGTLVTAQEENPASFSNFATTSADQGHTIAAPGVCIKSTWKGSSTAYNTISGTSMASPHMAGAAALCIRSGRCSDADGDGKVEPSEVMAKLRADAASWDGANGFTGDPDTSPKEGRYYGYLGHSDGY